MAFSAGAEFHQSSDESSPIVERRILHEPHQQPDIRFAQQIGFLLEPPAELFEVIVVHRRFQLVHNHASARGFQTPPDVPAR